MESEKIDQYIDSIDDDYQKWSSGYLLSAMRCQSEPDSSTYLPSPEYEDGAMFVDHRFEYT